MPSVIKEYKYDRIAPTDAVIVNQLSNGNESTLEFLYDQHRSLLYSLALRITGSSRDADEVLQDVFVQLWRTSNQFDAERGSLLGWLLTITRSRCIDRIRQGRRFEAIQFDDARFAAWHPHSSSTHYMKMLVSTVLGCLPELQQLAISLAYFDGLTCEEISLRTGTPLGTVKTRLRTGLASMRKFLA